MSEAGSATSGNVPSTVKRIGYLVLQRLERHVAPRLEVDDAGHRWSAGLRPVGRADEGDVLEGQGLGVLAMGVEEGLDVLLGDLVGELADAEVADGLGAGVGRGELVAAGLDALRELEAAVDEGDVQAWERGRGGGGLAGEQGAAGEGERGGGDG